MKKNQYRLKNVVDLRKRAKDKAILFSAQRRRELELENEEMESRKSRLAKSREDISNASTELSEVLSKGASASVVLKHKVYIESLRENEKKCIGDVEEQKIAVERAEEEYQVSLNLLAESSKEFSVIEKHKEKWTFEEKKRVNKQEQKLLEEIGSILHERAKKL